MNQKLQTISITILPTHVLPVSWKIARRIITANHYLGYAPAMHKFSLGIFCGCELAGVMIFCHPVARLEDQENTLELSRMFLFDSPKNSESRALSLAEKWIRANRKEKRIIAYADSGIHSGTIYKAANWTYLGIQRLYSWSKSRPNRRGTIGNKKLKFERIIS
ncbi:MAG: hypothetical protein PHZ02_01545 [Desulfocapsaceae bacterium]|nr:hypothetical protein [Desulfocapsaceae bacterium]